MPILSENNTPPTEYRRSIVLFNSYFLYGNAFPDFGRTDNAFISVIWTYIITVGLNIILIEAVIIFQTPKI